MKEELGKLTEQVVRGGQAVISGIKSETDKLIDEAVKLMDDKKKKTWSGYDTICLAQAPEGIVPGCIVLEGGSFRGCYTSGVLDVLMENGINLQTTIGTSAGALNGYNYVAGEIGRSAKINLGYRHDRRYIGPGSLARNRGVVGFDFLLDEIEQELPFNRERYESPDRRFLVTVTDCEKGEVIYCEKGVTQDFRKAIQASASMPFEKILVIRTRPAYFRRPQEGKRFMELSERFYRNYPELVERLNTQALQYNTACDELEQLQSEGRLLMLCPSGSVTISTLEGDMEKLGALYLLGRCDATIALPKIRQYLGIEE